MKKIKTIKINGFFICLVVFVFLCILIKLIYVSTGHVMVGNQTLASFANDRHTTKKVIQASRGTIFSSSGEVLAKSVNSYTVIAILSESRTTDINNPQHVVDKEMTAEALAPIINMDKDSIMRLLNTKIEYCNDGVCENRTPYQVELGPGGRGITELVKDQIDALDLPGIVFSSSTKRYYPNGNFLSNTLGYAKKNDNDTLVGEMGIEAYFNDELTGSDGFIEYQRDANGYQISNGAYVEQESISGHDVYLTIDDNIQMYTEQAVSVLEEGKPEWAIVAVMDAKTGAILGVGSSPNFNNNLLNIKSYYDPFVSYTYEPGSTLKIFSFLAAMENGIYNGDATYKSGTITVDDTVIKDWNKYGWGTITYDQGFMGSSNVAATKLGLALGRAKLRDFYDSLGFGSRTGITLPNEEVGIINFRYNTEIASASFGQGMTVTAAQMLQALSVISNDGVMLKPYIVSKVVDGTTKKVIKEYGTEKLGRVASSENVNHIISLMRGVVDGSAKMSTGTQYYLSGYDLVGKTGTAEIASDGSYLKGTYVKSFAGIFPGNDPQVVVYVATSRINSSNYLTTSIRNLVTNVGTYLNIQGVEVEKSNESFIVGKYINQPINETVKTLKDASITPIVIGDGDTIVSQYPQKNTALNVNGKIFLITNGGNNVMANINGWSKSDVQTYCAYTKLNCSFDGNGYVYEYSIKKDVAINENDPLEIKLKPKYENNEKKEE